MSHQATDPRWDRFADFIAARVIAKLSDRKPQPTGEWLTTEQAARHVGRSKKGLAHLRISGGGPSFSKIGRVVRYRRADLDSWLEQHKVGGAT